MSVIPENIIVLPNLDLKNGESLEIALSNLAQLEHQFSKICSNLDQRLANLKGKLGGINQRIGTSRQKVETLKDINEAITIVSPSKFVRVYKKGQDITYHYALNTDYVNNRKIPPFNYENNTNLNTNIKNTPTPGQPGSQPTAGNSHSNHDDELRKIVKLTRGTFNTKRELFSGSLSVQNQRFYGLGRIPRDIKFIDSLVVFNSKHNPYQKYVNIDNTASNAQLNVRKKKKEERHEKSTISEAPKTLMEGDMLTLFGTEDHRFKPEAKVLPQLAAPTQLGLKGIVNINLGNYEVDGLTPSKGGTVNRPTVPDPKFTDQAPQGSLMDQAHLSMQRFSNVASGNDNSNANAQNVQSNQNQNMTQSSAGYNYAPTLSQNRQVNYQAPQVSQPQPTMNTSTAQRPNVAQPQVTQATPVQQNSAAPVSNPGTQQAPSVNTAQPAAPKPSGGGGRAALLDEIRNPKLKLKKAAPVEEKAPLERKGGSKPPPAMNHMDHLKQQIQLRFQALNKKKKEESSDEEDDE